MNKKELSRTLEYGTKEEVENIASIITKTHNAIVIKEPEKTMVMIKAKEPSSGTLFYLGEMLATQCYVEVDGVKGISVMYGDNLLKAKAAAIIDAAHSAKISEWEEIEKEIQKLETSRVKKERKEAALYRNTQVNFKIMEDNDGKEVSI